MVCRRKASYAFEIRIFRFEHDSFQPHELNIKHSEALAASTTPTASPALSQRLVGCADLDCNTTQRVRAQRLDTKQAAALGSASFLLRALRAPRLLDTGSRS